MSKSMYERVRANPKFQELVVKRSRMAWRLSAVVLAAYYGFIAVVAFAPQLLHTPLVSGARTSVGVLAGAGILVLSWILTGFYVRRANTEFDALNTEILREAL